MYRVGKCRLKELSDQTGMRPVDLAQRTGYSESSISEWARGEHVMRLEVAKNISAILGCDIEDLYEWIPRDS
ncbi:helix-turn-helix domain-containing protein [Salibacterium aidingense]|uniref:helix-turn-helix domain-containing protein n=1 Tax=Salibacterium aidingense TaxID=384933 RepID=UPI003BC436F1